MFERDSFVLLNADGTIPWTANQDANGNLLQNLLDPVNPQDAATRAYVLANGAGNWSTFPAVSDVDMGVFNLTNVDEIHLYSSGIIAQDRWDTTHGSFLNMSGGDPDFGINNGEPAGVGADINLVSANGNVNIPSSILLSDSASFGTDTARISVNNAFTLQGVTGAQAAYFAQNMLYDGSMHVDMPIDDTLVASRFLMINAPGYVDDPNGGAFNWQTWTSGAGPIIWTSLMQLTPDGVLRVGANVDDGTGYLIQSAAGISATGNIQATGTITGNDLHANSGNVTADGMFVCGVSDGVTGTLSDGSAVTGGIITRIGP